ncbi:MAG: protein phosphatase 2C domain-containing protein [Gemmatimonadota bacterium]
MSHHLIIQGLSDIGLVRQRNEDSLVLAPDLGAAVVADGMGGHPGGDVASRIAAEYAVRRLRALLPCLDEEPPEDRLEALRRSMAQSVLGAHNAVRNEAVRSPSLDNMGTTLTALAVDGSDGTYAIGHVGDSRAYRLRAGALVQLTRDDTWVQDRVEAEQLTPEQARRHPFGHILTQCLGLEETPEPQVVMGTVEEGDVYLLCTDGLVGMLEDAVLAEVVTRHLLADDVDDPEEGCARALDVLVTLAKERGGHDNITVAILMVTPGA